MTTSLKILFGTALVCLSLMGCSDYLDKKMQEEVRQTLKEPDIFKLNETEVAELKDLGVTLDAQNNYPVMLVQAKFSTIRRDEIPSSMIQEFGQELSTLACSLLDDLSTMEDSQRQAIATVMTEDKVSTKFVLQDKTGQAIIEKQMLFTQCPQFEQFKTTTSK